MSELKRLKAELTNAQAALDEYKRGFQDALIALKNQGTICKNC